MHDQAEEVEMYLGPPALIKGGTKARTLFEKKVTTGLKNNAYGL